MFPCSCSLVPLFPRSLVLLFSCSLVLLFSCSLFSCSRVLSFSLSLVPSFPRSLVVLYLVLLFSCSRVPLVRPLVTLPSHLPTLQATAATRPTPPTRTPTASRTTPPRSASSRPSAPAGTVRTKGTEQCDVGETGPALDLFSLSDAMLGKWAQRWLCLASPHTCPVWVPRMC